MKMAHFSNSPDGDAFASVLDGTAITILDSTIVEETAVSRALFDNLLGTHINLRWAWSRLFIMVKNATVVCPFANWG